MARAFANSLYKSKSWKEVRAVVYEEANGICQKCGAEGEEVHHIIWLTPENISDWNIALGSDNLILLCKSCHIAIHRKKESTQQGLRFNEKGELVPMT